MVNPMVPIFWDLQACGARKLQTYGDTHTHTQENYSNHRCACAPRVNYVRGGDIYCNTVSTEK